MVARFVAAIALATTPLLAIGAAAPANGQTPSPADVGVRTRVEQVRVEMRVTDDRDNPVTNLQASDFEVTDDGERRTIAAFTLVTAASPASTTGNHSSRPTPAAQDAPAPPGASGRVVVVVLDDLHVAATNTPRVRDSVRTFIDTVVSAADSVATVFTSGANGGGQELTPDRRLVLAAVDRFRGQKLRSATVERLQDPRLNIGGFVDPDADPHQADRAHRARIALEALRTIAGALAAFEDRRPMVLFVSEGPEYEVTGQSRANRSDEWSVNRGIRDATEALNRVNALVFAIDPRGVASGNANQIHASSVFETAGAGTSAIQQEHLRAFGVVQAISTNTGGCTMLWRPDMSRDLRRVIAADSSVLPHKLRRTGSEPR